MYPSSIYFLYGYFGANVYTVWAHGPLGYVNHCLVDPTGLLNLVGVCGGLSMAGVSGAGFRALSVSVTYTTGRLRPVVYSFPSTEAIKFRLQTLDTKPLAF